MAQLPLPGLNLQSGDLEADALPRSTEGIQEVLWMSSTISECREERRDATSRILHGLDPLHADIEQRMSNGFLGTLQKSNYLRQVCPAVWGSRGRCSTTICRGDTGGTVDVFYCRRV